MGQVSLLTAPLDGTSEGHLVVRHGFAHTALRSNSIMTELYTARCIWRAPVPGAAAGPSSSPTR